MGAEKKHRQFTSSWGFVLSAVGSAVGMANVWGFPAKVGSNGGGAFLVAYLIFILLFSTVGLSAEYAMGRRARTGTLGTYEMAWTRRKPALGRWGALVGWLPLAGSMCIAIGYAVIIAYVLKGFAASLGGSLMKVDTGVWFESFSLAEYSVIPFHVVVVAGTLLTLLLGARSIERTNKVMMPLFFLIFAILAVRVALLPGAAEGYRYLFSFRWEELLEPMVWIWAMGQALFDTIAALVAALVIIPACFAYGLDVGAGPSLLFVTLPRILQSIPLGRLFAIILYIAMVFAGVSSLQNMFEAVGESLLHRFPRLDRRVMLGILCVICLGIGLHMEPIYKWGPWMDVVSIYIIPIGAALGAVSWFWIFPRKELLKEIHRGSKKAPGLWWHCLGRYVYVPCVLLLCGVALLLKVAF